MMTTNLVPLLYQVYRPLRIQAVLPSLVPYLKAFVGSSQIPDVLAIKRTQPLFVYF